MNRLILSLFSGPSLDTQLETKLRDAGLAIKDLDAQEFRKYDAESLLNAVIEEYRIEPLVLLDDQRAVIKKQEAEVDVTHRPEYAGRHSGAISVIGHKHTIGVPFRGEPKLWHLKPSTETTSGCFGRVNQQAGMIEISAQNTIETPADWYVQAIDSQIAKIKQYIGFQQSQLDKYHQELEAKLRTAIEARRKSLAILDETAKAFNIPIVPKEGMPAIREIEIQRAIRKPAPAKHPSSGTAKAYWEISSDAFEDILSIIRHAGISMEGTPATFNQLGEEDLRNVLLANLNAIYEGKATGETFRKKGKTDIRIEHEDRSAFVAECKLWTGEGDVGPALEQLLSYTTWRDCKTALIMFNKSVAKFKGVVLKKLPESLKKHSLYVSEANQTRDGEWRMVFKYKDDSSLNITVHVFAFNVHP